LVGAKGRLELVGRKSAADLCRLCAQADRSPRRLTRLRPYVSGKLVVVIGAGGDRDAGKRPLMGAMRREADRVIVTDDNPRSEQPARIRAAILGGAPAPTNRRSHEAITAPSRISQAATCC